MLNKELTLIKPGEKSYKGKLVFEPYGETITITRNGSVIHKITTRQTLELELMVGDIIDGSASMYADEARNITFLYNGNVVEPSQLVTSGRYWGASHLVVHELTDDFYVNWYYIGSSTPPI